MVGNIQEDFQLRQALSWNSGQTLTGSLGCFPEKVNHWDALRNMQQPLASSKSGTKVKIHEKLHVLQGELG